MQWRTGFDHRFDLIKAGYFLLPVAIELLLSFETSSLCRSKLSPMNWSVFTSVIDTMLTFVYSFCSHDCYTIRKQGSTCPIYKLRFRLIKRFQRFCHRSTEQKWFSWDVFQPCIGQSILCLGFRKAESSVVQLKVIFLWSCIFWNNCFYHWWWSFLDFFFATFSLLIVDLTLVEFELWNSLFACSSLIIISHCLHSQKRSLETWFMLIRCRFIFNVYTMTQIIHLCFQTYMTQLCENKINMNDLHFADWTRI